MKIHLNFIKPYVENIGGKKEVKNKYCQGCFLWLPIDVFIDKFDKEGDYCEDCEG